MTKSVAQHNPEMHYMGTAFFKYYVSITSMFKYYKGSVKKFMFIYNLLRVDLLFTMKVVENSPQNSRNCTIFKNFLGGHAPKPPLANARSFAARDMTLCGMYIQNPRNFKVGPPP